MFETKIWIEVETEEKQVREALDKIQEMDETFKYKIEKNFLIIESENKDQAFKRGSWLCSKVKILERHGYNVMAKI